MSTQKRTRQEEYEACDWCGKPIEETEKAYRITGDFPTLSVHTAQDPYTFHTCLREAVAHGISRKNS